MEIIGRPMEILTVPNFVLRKKSETVTFDDIPYLEQLSKDLIVTMLKHKGAGLAAPQIGVLKRVIAIKSKKPYVMFNPIIGKKPSPMTITEEGCLSIPGERIRIPRRKNIIVKYQDLFGKTQVKKFSGMDARVIQHEIDHLNGVLITDYIE